MRSIFPRSKKIWWLAAIFIAQLAPPELYTFLRRQLAFTPHDLGLLEKGNIIVKLPKTGETREVAAFAIMRLDVPDEFFIERVRDIVTFKKSANVLQIGKFSQAPQLQDLSGLTLDEVDIDAIRRCRLNNCELKLPAESIERFRREVSWSSPGYREEVTALTRQILLERVRAYLSGGNLALGEYNDRSYRLHLADEFRSLLQPAPYMYQYDAAFQHYLENYPNGQVAETEDFVYWSKEKYALKPVISLTHVTIHKRRSASGTDVLIASKGIYATHYFEASLGLTAFVHGQSDPRRTYLIYINRSRTDALRGFFGGLKRSLITGSLRDGARKNMAMIKEKLETEHRASFSR
ncbi:MAG: hypothetical protein HY646_05585 [Acidobacteria bacterium]|nr:hypothetical protein [Acidobacteriota bacterium]